MKNIITTLLFSSVCFVSFGQFAGTPETPGSTAMHKDSSAFINWASGCQLELGLIDISNEFSGTANTGDANSPIGFPDGNVVSLGDSGVAIITFSRAIENQPGPDFAVFENSFSDGFLELAFIEVSSDGIHFTRFPAISNTPTETQIGPFEAVGDPTLLYNLAGKYRANYGTPFDLEELAGIPGLDLSAISHVKIIDAVGKIDGDHVQFDSNSNPINDPHPTAFPSCGFDLEAIGVIHQAPLGIDDFLNAAFKIYPNPVQSSGMISISTEIEIESLTLYSLTGQTVTQSDTNSLQLENCPSGVYLLQIQTSAFTRSSKIVVR